MPAEAKPISTWMKGLAAILLLVNVSGFVNNIHRGIARALDVYPLDNAQALGYDAARMFILGFPLWVGWRLLAARSKN